MQSSESSRFLELAIFRFEDVCVNVQEGMDGYLKTAALEKKTGIEDTLRWLRRRQVSICLLTDYGRENLFLLLERIGWGIGEDALVQMVIVNQDRKANPVRLAFDAAGLQSTHQALVVADTSRLLHCATTTGLHLVFGVTNGRSTYQDLALEPFRALLDSAVQLPNHLLQTLPEEGITKSASIKGLNDPPRLRYNAAGQ